MITRHHARSFILTVMLGTVCLAASACGSSSTEDATAGLLDVGSTAATATATSVIVVTPADSTTNLVPAPTAIPLLPAVEVPTPTPVPINRSTAIDYEVQPGDVLGTIAERYGITLQALLEANNNLNPNTLSIGQTLVIPPTSGNGASGDDTTSDNETAAAATSPPVATPTPRPKLVVEPRTPGATDTHTIKDGQFLSIIAAAYDVSVDSIVALNGLASADSVFVGQQLQIPPVGTQAVTIDPTATAGPVATADPSATVDPALTPTVVATVDPDLTPTVVATVDPDLTPTVVATVDPDLTPTVVATVDPAQTVVPTATVDANATLPTVTSTPTPTPGAAADATATVIPCEDNGFGFDC